MFNRLRPENEVTQKNLRERALEHWKLGAVCSVLPLFLVSESWP